MHIELFTGGVFDTNCYFLPESGLLIDAPQGAAAWLATRGWPVRALLLTHGHIDHTWDAAEIQRAHGCRVVCHSDTVPLITERDFFKQFGFGWEIEPLARDTLELIGEAETWTAEGVDFGVLEVPGHCPGSLCFFAKSEHLLFGGDVLFAGSIGRTDLPGGDHALLLSGIREKVFPLGADIAVLSGHGPATTVGQERRSNPYVGEEM